ncbi:unnamed protein product [Orchesella dallaii]|uniref:Uncharacterized protein n=1 Tax=Orchesella dallaii TaxID=48710 RepID=A0ABP1QBK8_9HEXA
MNRWDFITLALLSACALTLGQVCSPPGQLCTRTTDCCKGCCEAHTCVERTFACSTDLVQQPGFNSCYNYFCPNGQICFLRDVCPPENPCPQQPSCRRIDMINNYSNFQYRNSIPKSSAFHPFIYFSICCLILNWMNYNNVV